MTLYAEWTRKATFETGPIATGSPADVVFYYDANEDGYYNGVKGASAEVALTPASGWEAVGWTTSTTGTTAEKTADFTLSGSDLASEETTYYAIAKRDVSLTYAAGDADAATSEVPEAFSATQTVNAGDASTAMETTLADQPDNLAKAGYVFAGWDTDGDGAADKQPGDTYTWANDGAVDVTATAVWVGEVSVTPPTPADGLVYNGTDQALLSAAGTSNAGTVVYSLSRNGDYADTFPTGKDAGSYTVWYKAVDANGRALSNPASVTATIGKATVQVTAEAATKVYGQDDPAFDYTVAGLITPDTKASMTGSLSRISGENVGDHAMTVGSLSAGKNYDISFTSANLTITKAQLTVKANDNTITYGDAPSDAGADFTGLVNGDTAASLGALTYTYDYSQYGDVGNAYKITPSGLSNGNYDITYQDGTLTVEQREVTLAWASPAQFGYDGSPHTWDAPTVGNTVNGDVLTAVWKTATDGATDAPTATDAGTYAPVVDRLADATSGADKAKNYKLPANTTGSWSIEKPASNTLTVTIAGWTYGKYNATANAPHATADFGVEHVEYTYSDSLNGTYTPTVPTNAGDYYVKATIPGTDNYPGATATCAFTIAKANITVTAVDQQSVRTTDPSAQATLTCSITGDLVADDEADLKATYVEASAIDTVDLGKTGSYRLKADWKTGKTEHPNYDVTFVGGTYTVTRALANVTAKGYTGTYDGVADDEKISVDVSAATGGGGSGTSSESGLVHSGAVTVYYAESDFQTSLGLTTAQITALKGDNVTTDDFKNAWSKLQTALEGKSTTSPAYKDAGTYTVYFMVVSDQVTPDVIFGSKDVVINKAPLTVTANNKTIAYGADAANDGVKYSDFVNSETESDLSGALAYDYDTYEAGSPVGNYPITPSGLSSDNYDITYVPGTLTVGKAKLTLTWPSTDSFTYSGAAQSYGPPTLVTPRSGDDVKVELNPGTGTATDVGDYTATVARLAGDDAANYELDGSAVLSHAWHITKADLVVRAKDNTITYGGAPADNGVQYESPEGTEIGEPTLEGALAFTFGSYVRYGDAGTYANEIVPSGLTSPNYSITFKPGTLTVEPRTLTLTWPDPDEFDYTGQELEYGEPTPGNIVNGDDVSIDAAGYTNHAATDAGVYTAQVSALAGAKAANYVLPDNSAHDWVIHGVQNAVTVSMDDWMYGDEPAEPVAAADYGQDDIVIEYAASADGPWSAEKPTAAGSYWVRASVAAASSYDGAEATDTFAIKKRPVTVKAADQVVKVGGAISTAVSQASLSNAAAGDALSAVTLVGTSTEKATDNGVITPSAAFLAGSGGVDVTANYEVTYEPGKLIVVGASATENGKTIYLLAEDVWMTVGEAAKLLAASDTDAQLIELTGAAAFDNATGEALPVQVADRSKLVAAVGDYPVTFKTNPEVTATVHVTDSATPGNGDGPGDGKDGDSGSSSGKSSTRPGSTRSASSSAQTGDAPLTLATGSLLVAAVVAAGVLAVARRKSSAHYHGAHVRK